MTDWQLPPIPDLPRCLARLIAAIPRGRVATMGQLAQALGDVRAARWIGEYLVCHSHHARCACHRVVRSDGSLGNYATGDVAEKEARLVRDGVAVVEGRVEVDRHRVEAISSDSPLLALREVQHDVGRLVRIEPRERLPELVGGVDVSYRDECEAVAALALVSLATGELVWHGTSSTHVRFPYISTFLAFRELPALVKVLELADRAGRLPEVLLVDGSGVLHQQQVGIASHLGVVTGLATVGVMKTLLCGVPQRNDLKRGESCPVVLDEEPIAVAMRLGKSARPLYVSPGHRCDVAFAERLVRAVGGRRRLPDPLYWADRLSREAARAPRE